MQDRSSGQALGESFQKSVDGARDFGFVGLKDEVFGIGYADDPGGGNAALEGVGLGGRGGTVVFDDGGLGFWVIATQGAKGVGDGKYCENRYSDVSALSATLAEGER